MDGAAGLLPEERAAWADDIAAVPDVEDFTDLWGDQ